MSTKGLRQIFLNIIIPSIIAIILFIVTIYAFIIPTFEKNMLGSKKEMIKELTNTAWSIVNEFQLEYSDSLISLETAKAFAAAKVKNMRYGNDQKDYFWITDMQPLMVMHPYREELNNQDLKNYQDPQGKRVFIEAVSIVKRSNEGYFEYMWQWKDDSTKIVDKLSYVKGYKPWNWVIGTGVYVEDVKAEISSLEKKLLRISFLITIFIIILLVYIIRQSLIIENKRSTAEQNLRISRERYKSLVEAATEGTLMIIDDKIVFSNKKLNSMLGYPVIVFEKLSFNELFNTKWDDILPLFSDIENSITIETSLNRFDGKTMEVVLALSKVKFDGQNGFIVIVKDVSKQKKIDKAKGDLTQELQTSLMLMNQPIKHFIKSFIKCDINHTAYIAAELMSRKKKNVIFVAQDDLIIGVVNDSDLRQRILAKGLDPETSVGQIMTSPIKSIQDHVLLYEAMLVFNTENISHLAVKNHLGKIIGIISNEDILNLHRNSLSYLVREIQNTEDIEQMRKIQERIPVLVNALINSGAKTQNITRIISSIADSMTERLITLGIEECGPPPCQFAFIAMGSEGRMEQTLATDQDNAIILENLEGEKLEEANAYFSRFATKLNKNLDYVGYNYCKGNVMAKNPTYRQPIKTWKGYFTKWIKNSDPQSIIDASIFFDFRFIYGEQSLVDQLRDHIAKLVPKQSAFFYHMALSIINFKSPSSLTSFNVKEALLPFIGFVKIYSLQNNIAETNSLARLESLLSLEIIKKQTFDELVFSYDFLMLLRFRFQVNSIMNHENPGNEISGDQLTDIEKATLKKIFSELSSIQSKLSFDFKGSSI
ncbi:MAG: CBS domain-containing protein [Bacteroidetes bacterium]|nr:CBS domain-containing protein [Bacteroidota bacterium]MBT5529836.1 CBS domain-containing protein [Cytophagia bacterium]MBT3799915.1 CBS domain-containing protein [Bacteroidota bacterium]MBT3935885.1 CBS domain-containing protein [Bacteroidota bacterium]MBT4969656.1 CBS domain-containing protein [Bacteroidota bacterium]